MQKEDVLDLFRESGALLSGHFELRSGLHSDQFFQCALVLQYPLMAERLCSALADRLKQQLGTHPPIDGVISPALGGLAVGHELGRAFGVRAIFAEKQDGGLVLRRGFEIQPGERFIVAEDVITRGGRVQETMDIVTARGASVEAIGVLVDRSGGAASFAAPLVSLVDMKPVTWEPSACPLCRDGGKPVHPGS